VANFFLSLFQKKKKSLGMKIELLADIGKIGKLERLGTREPMLVGMADKSTTGAKQTLHTLQTTFLLRFLWLRAALSFTVYISYCVGQSNKSASSIRKDFFHIELHTTTTNNFKKIYSLVLLPLHFFHNQVATDGQFPNPSVFECSPVLPGKRLHDLLSNRC